MTYYGVINAIPNEYNKSIKPTNAQQGQPTQQSQSLKALTTKAIRKSFVNHIFEVPTATQRLDNGLPPDHINDYFNLALSSTKETKLIMFQYKVLHDIVFAKEKLFRANIANTDLCYRCLETKQDLKHMLISCQFVSEFWEAFLYWYKSHVSIGLEPGGGGGVLPYMGDIGMCRCEGYGFQAVYSRTSRIGYINQSVWVWKRVSFFRKLICWLKILSRLGKQLL